MDNLQTSGVATIAEIQRLENAMRAFDPLILEPKHHFGPGVYLRELFLPAGTLAVGKMHKTEHLSVLAQGELSVWTEAGMRHLTAPAVLHSFPGCKRVAYAHQDSTFICVHVTPETDLGKLEDALIMPELLENVF